jgi:hypothetical protein
MRRYLKGKLAGVVMPHARIAAIGIGCAVLAACALPANADDDIAKRQKLIHAVCRAGRLGLSLELVADLKAESTPEVLKNIWEGCRQESATDLSCYPYTLTQDGKSRVIYMPGTQPSDARYDPLTEDCKGRVGRWPAWRDAKEDPSETYRMGHFYANNPPGELPKARSR